MGGEWWRMAKNGGVTLWITKNRMAQVTSLTTEIIFYLTAV